MTDPLSRAVPTVAGGEGDDLVQPFYLWWVAIPAELRPPEKILRITHSVHDPSSPDKFECIGQGRSAWCKKAELSEQADSETPRRLPHGTYVLHRTGCSQAEDQLLREGPQWPASRRRLAARDTF